MVMMRKLLIILSQRFSHYVFWPLVAIQIEIGYSAGRSGTKSPSIEGLCFVSGNI